MCIRNKYKNGLKRRTDRKAKKWSGRRAPSGIEEPANHCYKNIQLGNRSLLQLIWQHPLRYWMILLGRISSGRRNKQE